MTSLLKSSFLPSLSFGCALRIRISHAIAAMAMGTSMLASAQAPSLQPLAASDIPAECGCEFNRRPGETLLFVTETEPRHGIIRVEGKTVPLRLFEEKFLPTKRVPAHVNDHRVVYLSNGTWNVQMAGIATGSCAPKAKRCSGTSYRSKLILQWEGRNAGEINGAGHCSC